MPSKILVTGGAGFLGSNLCKTLLARGNAVICIDNFYTGSKKNIEECLSNPNFELIEHDVCFPLKIDVDQIYNLACPASPLHYQVNPVQTTRTSIMGAFNMLDLAKSLNAKILQASTSEVYGDPQQHPQQELYWGHVNPIGLRACYDEGKRCAETLFYDYHRLYKTKIKIARIFNTYGPQMQQNDGRVVSNFIVQALRNLPLTLYGQGLQTRSFCFVTDLIEGLIMLMESGDEIIGPINLGNPNEYTIGELAIQIRDLTRSKSELVYQSLPHDDPKQRKPDITYAKEKLGWAPIVPLKVGLLKTIDYFNQLL